MSITDTIRTEPHTIKAVRENYGWSFYEVINNRRYFIGNQAAGPIELPSCEEINRRLTPFGRHTNVTVTMEDRYYNSPRQNGDLPWQI
jgi:hypothetical protein